jgi:hypothetical protein
MGGEEGLRGESKIIKGANGKYMTSKINKKELVSCA